MVESKLIAVHPLRAWREARGLSQQRLADRLLDSKGNPLISRVSLCRIEQGRQAPSFAVMAAVALVTNGTVTPNDFVAWAGSALKESKGEIACVSSCGS